jgi:hypothetical protein
MTEDRQIKVKALGAGQDVGLFSLSDLSSSFIIII